MKKACLLILLLAAGCASAPNEYVRDGVQYGVTDGPFRGRWWSYYERGKSFLDGGFLEEARTDFQRALDERDEDQRWARTYGLHFVPQYFPNRELGVTLYYQDDPQGAVAALETSQAQQPSARAEYFLRMARRKMAAALNDQAPPTLALLAPAAGTPVATPKVMLSLDLSDNSFVDTLDVSGVSVPLGAPAARRTAATELALAPGMNEIPVRVTDIAGNALDTTLQVELDLDGPLVSFEDPVTLPGVVRGMARDPAGIKSFTVEGVEAALSEESGVTRFEVKLAQSDLAPPLRFEAVDALGNHSSGALPLAVLKVAENLSALRFAATDSVVRVARNLDAWYAGNQLVALAKVEEPAAGPSVRFENLADGQRYLLEEIVVDLEVAAPAGVSSLTLNGAPVAFFADRPHQRISRRVPLPKEGPTEIVAVLRDGVGATQEARVTVQRQLTGIEAVEQRLSLAILGNIWEGVRSENQAEEQFISDELTRILFDQGRFDLLSRDTLPEVLTEQELTAAVGARNGASPLREIVPAELMTVGMVRKDPQSIEIILQAINLENSQLMGYADVAGKADTRDELRQLVRDLALRFIQEFPRAQGRVVEVRSGPRVYSSLGNPDRIRKNMKCLVYRHGEEIHDPATGALLGAPTEIIAEGWFDEVTDKLSVVKIGGAPEPAAPIGVQDLVIAK